MATKPKANTKRTDVGCKTDERLINCSLHNCLKPNSKHLWILTIVVKSVAQVRVSAYTVSLRRRLKVIINYIILNF